MTNSLPIPDELGSQVPPEAQAALAALFLGMQQQIHNLKIRATDLEARLRLNSTNSHKPPENVRETFICKPTTCRRCGHGLLGEDPTPLIHQVAERPRGVPIVDEYRLHHLACPDCGETTCGTWPPGVPRGSFGPYLQAVLAVWN